MKKLFFVLCSFVLLIASCNTGKINSPTITPVALDANNLDAQDGAQVLQESEPVQELSSLNLEDDANAGPANVANLAISTDALEPLTADGMRVVQENVERLQERDAPISQNTNATNSAPVASAQSAPATNNAQTVQTVQNDDVQMPQNQNATNATTTLNNAQNANSLPSANTSALALAEEPVVQRPQADTQNTPVVDMRTNAQNNSNANAQNVATQTNASSANNASSTNRATPNLASNATVPTSSNSNTQTRRITTPLVDNTSAQTNTPASNSSAQNGTSAQNRTAQNNVPAQNRTAQNGANAQNRTTQNNVPAQNRTAQTNAPVSNSSAQTLTQVQNQVEEEILPLETEVETLPFENLPKVEPLPLQVEPSRSALVLLNQYLDVVYPGAGWVYLGEVDETKNLLSFHSRKLLNTDTSFVLRAKIPGETILHFYKQDVLTGTYIDDYLAVTVSEEAYTGMEHSSAPAYADVVPPNQQKYQDLASGNTGANSKTFIPANADSIVASAKKATDDAQQKVAQDNQVATNNATSTSKKTDASMSSTIQIDESSPNGYTPPPRNLGGSVPASRDTSSSSGALTNVANLSTEQLLEEAKKAYKNNQMTDSLTYLDHFFAKASTKLDEALFLKGQLYESKKSSFVNVRTALDAYQTLVEQYPSSTLWRKANERITYINRFYFKAR